MPVQLCLNMSDDGAVVRPGEAGLDGCAPLATRNTFTISQNQCAVLEWVVRAPNGEPYDLTGCYTDDSSASVDDSILDEVLVKVLLRVDRAMRRNPNNCAPVEIEGEIYDAENGIIRAQLVPASAAASGIYRADFALQRLDTEALVVINHTLLSVEPSLFAVDYGSNGPPTINEIRVYIRDASPELNRLLLSEEYTEREVLEAIIAPVREWNETTPRLRAHQYDTQTFPFKQMWLVAIQAYLLRIASHHYRRNQFTYQAAGVSIRDLDKEQQYLQASELMFAEWRRWMKATKAEINLSEFGGSSWSGYSYYGH